MSQGTQSAIQANQVQLPARRMGFDPTRRSIGRFQEELSHHENTPPFYKLDSDAKQPASKWHRNAFPTIQSGGFSYNND